MFIPSGAAPQSRISAAAKKGGLQGRVMWFDAAANLWELSTREGVAGTIAKCKQANINTIVVDVKPLSGQVLYKSSIAPRLAESNGRPYPADYDLLQTVLDEGHKAGIKVHAAINVLSEGSQKTGTGPALEHPDWQCVQYGMRRKLCTDDASFDMVCNLKSCSSRNVYLYGRDPDDIGDLAPNTAYVRVAQDGTPLMFGTASGKARLSAPEGGYVVAASGEAADWLKRTYESKQKFRLEAESKLVPVSEDEATHNAVFVNPLNPEARAYALSVIREICADYPLDGIVLDRMRYPNIYSDFSELTRAKFEQEIGRKVERWPEDVYTRDPAPGDDVRPGPLFKKWLKFRSGVIRDFLVEARSVVKKTRPAAKLGIYVGSWYPLYYDVGVNWGSRDHSADYSWWPRGYEDTGYADLVDYLCTGCYYTYPTREDAKSHNDAEWKSVQAAAEESINAVKDATVVYGSLYLLQYSGSPEQFRRAIHECLDKTQGCMFFDLVYVRNYDWWNIIRDAFPTPAKAPHDVPGLLEQARSARR